MVKINKRNDQRFDMLAKDLAAIESKCIQSFIKSGCADDKQFLKGRAVEVLIETMTEIKTNTKYQNMVNQSLKKLF